MWLQSWLAVFSGGQVWAASPASPASFGLGLPIGFVAQGWFGRVMSLLRSYIVRAGLGFVWGSFRLGKGLICRMLLGGFEADFESVWVGLELICARCAAWILQ